MTKDADPLKGAVALVRCRNDLSNTFAYVLAYPYEGREGAYVGIGQAASWDKTRHPKRLKAGCVGGMDGWALEHGEIIHPKDFPHELVGIDDVEDDKARRWGARRARPEEQKLP